MEKRYEKVRHDLLTELKIGDQLVTSTYKIGTGDPARNFSITVQVIQSEWVRCEYGFWHHLADTESRLLATAWHKQEPDTR